MDNIINTYIGDINFKIVNFERYPQYDILRSKLDTFTYKNIEVNGKSKFVFENKKCLCVKNIINKDENLEFIYKEKYGFFSKMIFKENNQSYLCCIKRNSTEEIQLIYKVNLGEGKCQLIYDSTNTNGIYAFENLSTIFSYYAITQNYIVFHGVILEYKGKGIIISAPSGTGKTTHARMWRDTQRGLIINGDRALCKKIDGKWTGFGMPWCGTSGEYINRSIQIDAIVVLEQAKENSVEKLDILQAFNHMIPNITAPTWEKNLLNKSMDYLEDIINEIPVYKLKCTPDIEAVDILKKEIDKL